MEFHTEKPIYRQIVDHIFSEILSERLAEGDKVPSVRELAARMGVSSVTAVKAYDYLADRRVIGSRRGLGYFVLPGAHDAVKEEQRQFFFNHTLQETFRQMRLLGITLPEIEARWKEP